MENTNCVNNPNDIVDSVKVLHDWVTLMKCCTGYTGLPTYNTSDNSISRSITHVDLLIATAISVLNDYERSSQNVRDMVSIICKAHMQSSVS